MRSLPPFLRLCLGLSACLFLSLNAIQLFVFGSIFGDAASLDTRVAGYSVQDARDFLDVIGAEGRAAFFGYFRWVDTVFPPMLTLSLIALFRHFAGADAARGTKFYALLPFAYLAADLTENSFLKQLQFNNDFEQAVGYAASATILKYIALALAVAAHFGFAHLDTGLLYRAVGAKTLLGVEPIEAARDLRAEDLNVEGLRRPDVAQAASKVAVIADVRAALVDFQRAFAQRSGGAVLDGRDIGTVICPEADVKLFVTASSTVRAERRFLELSAKGDPSTREEVLADVQARDARDMERVEAPLKPASDAVLIDTSDMSIEAAVAQAVALIEAKRT